MASLEEQSSILKKIEELYRSGCLDEAEVLLDMSVERHRDEQWEDYCEKQDHIRYLKWLENPFNKAKLKQKFENQSDITNFDWFCEYQYEEFENEYVTILAESK